MPEDDAPRAVELDAGRILLAGALLVYLERTLVGPRPLPPGEAPRGYGLAPAFLLDPGTVLTSVGLGEAIWLGFQAVDPGRPVRVRVRNEGPEPCDAVSGASWEAGLSEAPRNHLLCPPDYHLAGRREPAGYVPFEAGELTVFSCEPRAARVSIRIADPATFAERSGTAPPPLDPDSAYKGWRLP